MRLTKRRGALCTALPLNTRCPDYAALGLAVGVLAVGVLAVEVERVQQAVECA